MVSVYGPRDAASARTIIEHRPSHVPTTTLDAQEALDALIEARRILLIEQRWFGQLSLPIKTENFVVDWHCRTMWTDGTRIGFNPQWVLRRPRPERIADLAHEIMHCALGHPWRIGARDIGCANIAGDLIITPLLRGAGLKTTGHLFDERFVGLSLEAAYDLVLRDRAEEARKAAEEAAKRQQEQEASEDEDSDEQENEGDGADTGDEDSDEAGNAGTNGDESDESDEDAEEGADGSTGDEGDEGDDDTEAEGDDDSPAGKSNGKSGKSNKSGTSRGDSDEAGDESDGSENSEDAADGSTNGEDDEAEGTDRYEGAADTQEESYYDDESRSTFRRAPSKEEDPEAIDEGTWQKIAQEANIRCRKAGDIPGGAEVAIDAQRSVSTDWRAILRNFLSECGKDDYSWCMPNNRFVHRGLYLPGYVPTNIGEIAVGLDISGSVVYNTPLLAQLGAELTTILTEVQPERLIVYYFDYGVQKVEEYYPGDVVELRSPGGGGTDFSAVFTRIDEDNLSPLAVVMLTDLECTFPQEEPPYPVLWAVPMWTRVENVPFGEIVHISQYD
jgi:predicted metal-dependent peptidase